MDQKNDNKSVYIYAGLIFLVAIVIIIIAFFGQEKIQKEAFIEESAQPATSIVEKASVLSDENRLLSDKVNELTDQMTQKDEQITGLNQQIVGLNSVQNNTNVLIQCYTLCGQKKYEEANSLFSSLDINLISEDAMPLYQDISKKITKGLK